jgi:hypothetical protein
MRMRGTFREWLYGADERGAHHRLVAGDRIEQPHRIRFAGKVRLPARLDEAEVDHLAVVACREPLAQGVQASSPLGQRQHLRGNPRRVRGNALEAVQARHLFDQIFLDREVKAVGGRFDDKQVILP